MVRVRIRIFIDKERGLEPSSTKGTLKRFLITSRYVFISYKRFDP
jgi:hypothetical protein